MGQKPAGVAGFGAVFIDADFASIGPSSLAVYNVNGALLGE